MKPYLVKIGLSGPLSQPELLDLLKNEGCEALQTSDGVCFKTDKEISNLQSIHAEFAKLHVQNINLEDEALVKSLSPDIQIFICSV